MECIDLHMAHALVTGIAASRDLVCQCMSLSSALLTCHVTTQVSMHMTCILGRQSWQCIALIHCSLAGDLAIQLPPAQKEHSAGMGSSDVVHFWSSKRLRGVVPDM